MTTNSLRLQAEKDRISALPDHLIQHILSLLPSTKEAIRTTVLSKTWHNQWTRVPVLVFDSTGMSAQKFSTFIDNTLLVYNSSKIKKFHIQVDHDDMVGDLINWDVKFRFAITRDVEEVFMILRNLKKKWRVPRFVFKHSSYVKLFMFRCDFTSMPNRSVSWGNLKTLSLSGCVLPNQAIENILSGSPSLESFNLWAVYPATHQYDYDIVSKSLKNLILFDYDWSSTLQISCPALEDLYLYGRFKDSATLQLMDPSSLISATLRFEYDYAEINNIMQYLKHVKKLKFGSQFIKSLSALKSSGADLSPLLLNNKSLMLILFRHDFEEHYAGIECALRLSYVLEKLVIELPDEFQSTTELSDMNVSGENYWNSNTTIFNCLGSHLKIVEIYCRSEITYIGKYYMFVLNFIEFLLKNARVLEKLLVRLLEGGGNDFMIQQFSKKLLDFPRCSQHATVELLSSN